MSIAGATDRKVDWRGSGAASGLLSEARPQAPVNDNPDEIFRWRNILRRLGVPIETAAAVARRSNLVHGSLQTGLVADGIVREADLYREIASEAGLAFEERIDPYRIVLEGSDPTAMLGMPRQVDQVRYGARTGEVCILVAPERLGLRDFQTLLIRFAGARHRIRVTTPSAIREALIVCARPRLIANARDKLFLRAPDLSARIVANGWQGLLLGCTAATIAVASVLAPWQTLLGVHIFFSVFFLACIGIRIAATPGAGRTALGAIPAPDVEEMPRVSVLVALRHEAEIIPDLLVALGRLVWPRTKFDVKLICEVDDTETIAAIQAQPLRPWIEIVEVPRGMPKTKPNALNYALPFANGEIIALFDAEDRPHPFQLIEAWKKLSQGGPDLACVQAPLDIDNAGEGVLPHAFQLEYAALFRGLLPWLARRRLILPLGGTSNHFRRQALERVLAWDPYNVTEDADLGVRLARFGYRTDTITLPTAEDAPDTARVWLRQRTRWFKGWIQTWLVHMRDPARLIREIGWRSFLATQVLFAGMLVSALFHPLMLVTGLGLAARYTVVAETGLLQSILFWIDAFNISVGYASFLLLGWRSLPSNRRDGFWKPALFLPVYWLMMTAAAWRAVYQTWTNPHLWEKTPHKRHRLPSRRAGVKSAAFRAPP